MKKGWTTKRLEEVCEIARGGSPRPIENFLTTAPDGINWVKIGDATASDKYIYKTEEKITADGVKRSRMVHEGDFLLSNSMSFGRPYIMKTTGCIHDGWLVLRQRENQLEQDFLYYLLSSDELFHQFDRLAAGSTVRNLNIGLVKGVEISFPPLSEQQRIVGVLDEAFAGLATAQANAGKNLQNARALFDSVLSRSVIGETTKRWREAGGGGKTSADCDLKELSRKIEATDRKPVRSEETTGRATITEAIPKEWRHASIEQLFNLIDYRGKTASKSETGHRLITARNIRMGFLSEDPVTFISKEQYKKWMVRGFPKPGDIFFVTEGHTMGFVALNTRTDEFALAQRTITLQPPVRFSTKFFFYFMLSPHFQKLVKLNATGAAAVGMKASKFRSLPLAFPSFAEQEVIVTQLDALAAETQRLTRLYEQKQAALAALKKSLLHQAFSGAL
jgi:type I restriction enzyme, S subunit